MFKTDYMALLIATNLYDTVENAIHGEEQKINQIKQVRERTGGGLKFCKDIIEAVHTHSRPYVYDVIKTIYLAELNRIEEYEKINAIEQYKTSYPPASMVPVKKEEEEATILFEDNEIDPYHAKSIGEVYRVRDLVLRVRDMAMNDDGDLIQISGIYKKIL